MDKVVLLIMIIIIAVGAVSTWKEMMEDEGICPHGYYWDDCPDCRH